MTLGEIISAYRKEHDISQRTFAKQCDVSNGYISMLEAEMNPKTGCKIVPTIPLLKKLSKGMAMTLDELLDLADDIEVDLSKNAETLSFSYTPEAMKAAAIDWIKEEATTDELVEILQLVASKLQYRP